MKRNYKKVLAAAMAATMVLSGAPMGSMPTVTTVMAAGAAIDSKLPSSLTNFFVGDTKDIDLSSTQNGTDNITKYTVETTDATIVSVDKANQEIAAGTGAKATLTALKKGNATITIKAYGSSNTDPVATQVCHVAVENKNIFTITADSGNQDTLSELSGQNIRIKKTATQTFWVDGAIASVTPGNSNITIGPLTAGTGDKAGKKSFTITGNTVGKQIALTLSDGTTESRIYYVEVVSDSIGITVKMDSNRDGKPETYSNAGGGVLSQEIYLDGTANRTMQLSAVSDEGDQFTFSSNDTTVAAVTNTGLVTYVGKGDAVITVTAQSKSKLTSNSSVKINVHATEKPSTYLTLTDENANTLGSTMGVPVVNGTAALGGAIDVTLSTQDKLTAAYKLSSNVNTDYITATSTNSSVATATPDGRIVAHAAGTADITFSATGSPNTVGNAQMVVRVTVSTLYANNKITASDVVVNQGTPNALINARATYDNTIMFDINDLWTEDASQASGYRKVLPTDPEYGDIIVSSNGYVNYVKDAGVVYVRLYADANNRAEAPKDAFAKVTYASQTQCKLYVTDQDKKDVTSLALKKNDPTKYLIATSNFYGTAISATSTDEKVVAVSYKEGVISVTPVSEGSAYIIVEGSVTKTSGYSTPDAIRIPVTVTKAETTISYSPTDITITAGQKQQITAKSSDTTATLTYTSADSTIATVSSTGLVTAKKAGSTYIVISDGTNGITVPVTVKAVTKPAKVTGVKVTNVKGAKAKVSFKTVSGANGYVVSYTVGSKTKTKTITSTSTKINVAKKKTVKVKVRAYKKSGSSKIYGAYSAVKKFKTDKK